MTKRWIWAGVIASLLALTACADKPASPNDPLPDSAVLGLLREQTTFFDNLSDERTLHILESTCEALEVNSVEDVVAVSVGSGLGASDAVAAIVAAATARCPDQLDEVDDFIATWGSEQA